MPSDISSLHAKHAPTDEIRHLRSENQRLMQLLQTRKQASGQISEAMTEILASVRTIAPVKLPPIKRERAPVVASGTPVTQVAHITDWHIGEVTNPQHTEEFGETNFAIASGRIAKFSEQLVHKGTVARSGHVIDDLHILGTADWVSGDIHDELIRTNEFPSPVAAVKAGFLLGSFMATLAPHYKKVTVDLITAGNHDRITRKPQSSDGGLNSWGYIVCEIARQQVTHLKNVEVRVHTALTAITNVANTRYLITHGDGIKGTWGIPFYGIERKKQREAMSRMNMDPSKHFDKIVIGHFHTALNHEHWLVGGSLSGTTAHDHKEGRHSRPHQTSWFVHPEHGEFAWERWWL